MRVLWLTGVVACLAVQGCAPLPGQYYGAPPGYAPQPYAATGGVVEQPPPPYDDTGYAEPGYAPPVALSPGPADYGYATVPAYGYAPPPVLPPFGFFGRFGGGFNRDRFGRGRENVERERFERERFEQRVRERDRMRPPPGQPFQGAARPPEFHQTAGGPPGRPPGRPPERRGFDHMRQHP